jgi:hypothetical protein
MGLNYLPPVRRPTTMGTWAEALSGQSTPWRAILVRGAGRGIPMRTFGMALLLVAILLGGSGGVSLFGPFGPPAAPRALAPVDHPTVADSVLRSAEDSLERGNGPSAGSSWTCHSPSGGLSVGCGPAATAAPAPASPPSPSPTWAKQPLSPPGRELAGMTYDAVDKEIVLFGGYNDTTGVTDNDTWIYNGGWVQLFLATNPGARSGAAMAYDFKDKYVLLFGGDNSKLSVLSDTWKFVHGSWTHLAPSTPPGGLYLASMAWDVNDSSMVLFGGLTGTGVYSSQTYTYVAGVWTAVSPATKPGGRNDAQMGYDSTNGWILLYGGYNGTTGVLSDTWNYSRGHWTQQHPATTPGPVEQGSMSNDTSDGYLVLFGGANGVRLSARTWTYVNSTWTRMGPATPPPIEVGSSMTYDKVLNKLVMFGGYLGGLKGIDDGMAWTYHADSWTTLVAPIPLARAFATMTYDEADSYVLLFGGLHLSGPGNPGNDTWTYSHGRWTHLKTPVAPAPRYGASMAYDAADGYVVLFGGSPSIAARGYLNDTWTFVGGKWTGIPAGPGLPVARAYAAMAYDALDGYVVLFGGLTNANTTYGSLNDTWSFSGGVWTLLQQYFSGCGSCLAPSPRFAAAMGYDAADGVIVLFGGSYRGVSSTSYLGDTWEFSGGSWTNLTSISGTPPSNRSGAAMTFDGWDGYLLLFGGRSSFSPYTFNDTWNFSGGVWTQMSTSSTLPGGNYDGTIGYDAVDSTVVYLPGFPAIGGTWLY